MSIQTEIELLETNIDQLKENNLTIEEQIDLYNNALKKVNNIKKNIDELKERIVSIDKNHEIVINKTE